MKLRYFVGTPEDAFRKHDLLFSDIESADKYNDAHMLRNMEMLDTLLVYVGSHFKRELDLVAVVDLEDLCVRYDRIYKYHKRHISAYKFFTDFVRRLAFRRMRQLKEAA